jgi:general secretion pathway protein C
MMVMMRYFTIANVFLIALGSYFSVNAFYKVATEPFDHARPSSVSTKQIVSYKDTALHPLSHYNAVIERNLFNTKTKTGQQLKKLDIENLKPTDLKLKLFGTVTGDENKAYAVIEDTKERRQNLYRIGDTIQNASIKMILREKVVLRVNGKDEILGIEEVTSGSRVSGRPSSAVDRRSKKRLTTKRSRTSDSQNITLERSKLRSAVNDINNLMKEVRIQPHFKDGKPDGFRLTGVKPNSFFHEMGFKSGDIITGVDGKNIESMDDAFKLYQSLQSSSNVQLQLKRKGRQQTINYKFNGNYPGY